jgi:hypothetical protein
MAEGREMRGVSVLVLSDFNAIGPRLALSPYWGSALLPLKRSLLSRAVLVGLGMSGPHFKWRARMTHPHDGPAHARLRAARYR